MNQFNLFGIKTILDPVIDIQQRYREELGKIASAYTDAAILQTLFREDYTPAQVDLLKIYPASSVKCLDALGVTLNDNPATVRQLYPEAFL